VAGVLVAVVMSSQPRRIPNKPGDRHRRVVTRIVIVGGGFAGLSAAQRCEHHAVRGAPIDVTLVSDSNFLLFTPMLAEAASEAAEARHISAPVRAVVSHTRFRCGTVEDIDPDHRTVRVIDRAGGTETIPYDHLRSVARPRPATADTHVRRRGRGFRGHRDDRGAIRSRPWGIEILSRDRAERRSVCARHPGRRILPELSEQLGGYAQRHLHTRGIECLRGLRVSQATADHVQLSDGRWIATQTFVWTAGNQPSALVANLSRQRAAGALVTDAVLRGVGFDRVWAIGDCARVPDLDNDAVSTDRATRDPSGRVVADNIRPRRTRSPHGGSRHSRLAFLRSGHLVSVARNISDQAARDRKADTRAVRLVA